MRNIINSCKDSLYAELMAQRPNAVLLLPVFLSVGIGAYFSLDNEPAFAIVFIPIVLALLSCGVKNLRIVGIALLCTSLGFAAAKIRTHNVHTPILEKPMKFADISGVIISIERLDKGARIILSDVAIDDVDAMHTPRKIRLKLWKADGLARGQRIKGLAALNPPSNPAIPGGFNFRRYMYFKGIGAIGFMYKPPEVIDAHDVAGHGTFNHAFNPIANIREAISAHIQTGLAMPESSLARALIIGERSSMSKTDLDAIRDAGLAHILAISGLHVGLVAGAIFMGVRFLMALFPALALKHPIKKYAAFIAIAGAFFYMLLAGSTIPTQRAMISVLVIFTAIILDRSPISLRVVAFAAFCVLLFFPESLTSASFQMSFAAVTALVAFYDWTRNIWSSLSRRANWIKKLGLYVLGVCVTTIIATISTAPLTFFHFQTLPSYGLFANLICVPILAFWVMPLSILAVVAMPLGLSAPLLQLVKPGLDVILDIAHFTASIDGASVHVPTFASASLIYIILACLSVIILRKKLRLVMGAGFVLCAMMTFKTFPYDILVSSKSDLVVIHTPMTKSLLVSDARKSRFEREKWQQAMGMEDARPIPFPHDGDMIDTQHNNYSLKCDYAACRYQSDDYKLSWIKHYSPSVYHAECLWADIIISQDVYDADRGSDGNKDADRKSDRHGQACAATYSINRRQTKYEGVHAFYMQDGEIQQDRSHDKVGKRPWTQ